MADNSLGAKVGVPVVLPVIGEWATYTPTISGSTTAPTRGTATEIVTYRRVGSELEIIFTYSQTVAGTAGSGTYYWSLPSGLTVDTTKVQLLNTNIGSVYAYNGSTEYQGYVTPASTTQFGFIIFSSLTSANFISSTLVPLSNPTTRIQANFRVPILEWSGSATVAYGAGLATSAKSGLTPATATLGKIRVASVNGYGSTNTLIRRWSNVTESVGSDITYADSATLGGSFTIVTSGVYAMSYCDQFNAAANFGISRNGSGVTGITAITQAQRLCFANAASANLVVNQGVTLYLDAGDVIRAHTDSTPSGANIGFTSFSIQRVA